MSSPSASSIRRAITYYAPPDEQDKDQAPLQMGLIRRILAFTAPYARKRNALFVLTFLRGLQLPALAWMIGYTLKGPISRRDPGEIAWTAGAYLALAVVTLITLHFRYR